MSNWELPVQGPSVFERFKPRHLALADAVANQSRDRQDLTALMSNAQMGLNVDEQDKQEMQSKLADLTSQFVEQTKDLPDAEFQAAAQRFQEAYGQQMPERQNAQLQTPNLAQSAFALLGAALNPQFAADIVSTPFLANSQSQKDQQQRNDIQYKDQLDARSQTIDAAQTNYQVEANKLGKAQASQDRKAGLIQQQIEMVQKSMDKLDQREATAVNQAFSQWTSASRGSAKETAGKRLQALLSKSSDPMMRSLAPSDEDIQVAVNEINTTNSRYASQEWEKALGAELNAYGEVTGVRAQELEAQRMAIADRYGIDPKNLRVTPSGATLAAEKLALAQEQFKFLKSKTAEDFKIKYAGLKLAEQRYHTYAQSVANNAQLGQARVDIAAGNLAARNYESSLKGMAGSAKKEVQSLIDKIRREPDPEKAKVLRDQLNQLAGVLAQDMGVDMTQMLSNPAKFFDDFINALNGEQAQQETAPVNPFSGTIGGSDVKVTPEPTRNPKRTKKPVQKKAGLPSGWSFN